MDKPLFVIAMLVLAMMVAALWLTGATDWLSHGMDAINQSTATLRGEVPTP